MSLDDHPAFAGFKHYMKINNWTYYFIILANQRKLQLVFRRYHVFCSKK
jgi:hypothetical protein